MAASTRFSKAVSMLLVTFCTRVIAQNVPTERDRVFQIAASRYESGNFTEAIVQLERLEDELPSDFEVHELLGLCYGAGGEDPKAVEQFQIAIRLNPLSSPARNNLATGLVHAGRFKEAATQYRRVLEVDPRNYEAAHNLAELYLRENKFRDAVPLLEKAEEIRPEIYANGYDLALGEALLGRFEESRKLTERLFSQRNSAELHSLLGRIDEGQSRYIDAANEFAAAARMDPSEDNLFVWGSELLSHRTYQPAIDVFQDGTRRFPKSPRLWIGLGMSLYSRGEYEQSIRSLMTAADLDPSDPRCYVFLSKAYLSSPDQADDAILRFKKYADLEPKNALAQYYYAMGLWKGRRAETPETDYKSVETLLLRSIALDGTIADVHLQLGILYSEQHEFERSFTEYKRALQLDPLLADAHFRLGRYFLHTGEKKRAESEFEIFRKLQSEHQTEIDKERSEVQQFVVATKVLPSPQP